MTRLRTLLSKLFVVAATVALVLAAASYGTAWLAPGAGNAGSVSPHVAADDPPTASHAVVSRETRNRAEPIAQQITNIPPRPLDIGSVVRDVTEDPTSQELPSAPGAASLERNLIAKIMQGVREHTR